MPFYTHCDISQLLTENNILKTVLEKCSITEKNVKNVEMTNRTLEHGADLPDTQAAQASKLTKGKLKEKQGEATEHQHDEVREHEGP